MRSSAASTSGTGVPEPASPSHRRPAASAAKTPAPAGPSSLAAPDAAFTNTSRPSARDARCSVQEWLEPRSRSASTRVPSIRSSRSRTGSGGLELVADLVQEARHGRLHLLQDEVEVLSAAVVGVGDVEVAARLRVELPQQSRSEEHTSELQSRENLVCRL